MAEKLAFAVELDLIEPLPSTLDLGARFSPVVAIVTKSGCDLSGAKFEVFDDKRLVCEGALPSIARIDAETVDHDPRNGPLDMRDRARICLTAPREKGAFEWTLIFPEQEIDGVAHARATLKLAFATSEHATSLAVWDVPSPVVAGSKFEIIAGAKCTAGCNLTGERLELRDEAGCVVSTASLGADQWPGADGLYWTRIEATAPDAEGVHDWSIGFAVQDLDLPHRNASAALSFVVTEPGDISVCVTLVDAESAAPIKDAQVRLGFHRAPTDSSGSARFTIACGARRLFIWKAGYEIPERTLDVNQNLELIIEAKKLPPENPYERWQG